MKLAMCATQAINVQHLQTTLNTTRASSVLAALTTMTFVFMALC